MAGEQFERIFHTLKFCTARRIVPFVRETSEISSQSGHQVNGVRVSKASRGTTHYDQPERILQL